MGSDIPASLSGCAGRLLRANLGVQPLYGCTGLPLQKSYNVQLSFSPYSQTVALRGGGGATNEYGADTFQHLRAAFQRLVL